MSNLILRPQIGIMEISIMPEAHDVKLSLINNAKTLETINDGFEATMVADSQKSLRHLINQIEESRKAAKAPILEFGKRIDSIAKDFIAEVKDEETRIGRLLGAFQIVEREKKILAERIARVQECKILSEAAAAAFDDSDSIARIEEEALARIIQARQEAASKNDAVKGVKVRTTIEFEIESEAALLAARPDLFSPNHSKIRAALKTTTTTIPGIKAWEQIKSY